MLKVNYKSNYCFFTYLVLFSFTLQFDCIKYYLHLYCMKWISTILLLYILALLLVPCSDVYNNCTDTNSKFQEASHSHSQDNDDHCTPFCQCSCCSVSVIKIQFKLPDFNLPQHFYTAKKTVIKDCQIISGYFGNIWEPPKFYA